MVEKRIKVGNRLIAIFGPTTTAKTGLAINLARFVWGRFGIEAELISADSRKIYRGMEIGQSKIPAKVRQKIPVHLIDIIDLNQTFSLYEYKKLAGEVIDQAHRQNRLPILFGGTGIYVLSIVENWVVPKTDGENRKKPRTKKPAKYQTLLLSLRFNKKALFATIKTNVGKMFKKGLYQEFLALADQYNISPADKPAQFNVLYKTLAYREFVEYARDKKIKDFHSFSKADLGKIQWRITKDIKDYARRQMAWYKDIKGVVWVRNFQEARKKVEEFLTRNELR